MGTQEIHAGDRLLAFVVPRDLLPDATTFLTEPSASFQVGLGVLGVGGEAARHRHHPIERNIVGTSEVLLVRDGTCEVDIYDAQDSLVETIELESGDVIVFTGEGGHAVRSNEGVTLLEVKQGPFGGASDSQRF